MEKLIIKLKGKDLLSKNHKLIGITPEVYERIKFKPDAQEKLMGSLHHQAQKDD